LMYGHCGGFAIIAQSISL